MQIKTVRFKNFRSYGNVMKEFIIEQDLVESSLNLIVGTNGAGKTSISNAIVYCLYGKVDGVKNGDLCNRINKDLLVEVDLVCGNDELLVRRGQHPSLFEVYINGVLYDQAGKTNVQEILESSYYHIPYAIFKNLIVLNINDFKSLLTLTPGEKKSIIDKIFGFEILNEMSKRVKDDFKKIEANVSSVRTEMLTINQSIRMTKEKIENTPKMVVTDESKVETLQETLNRIQQNGLELSENMEKFKSAERLINNTIQGKMSDNAVLNQKVSEYQSKINLINKGKCPTCGSDFHTKAFEDEKAEYEQKIEEIRQQQGIINTDIETYRDKLKIIVDKSSDTQREISTLGQQVMEIKSELRSIEIIKNTNTDTSALDNLIMDFNEKLNKLEIQNNKLTIMFDMLNIAVKIFSDNGIKKYVGGKYTPVINEVISEITKKLQLAYAVRFDDSFKCVVTHCGREVDYDTLSSGEKRKLDFTVVISFLKILKLQFPGINLLFCDEIFATMDVNAIPEVVTILKELTEELKLNVFLIHHSTFDASEFDNVYEISKDSGFSIINKLV